jgi:hypothetical protein
MERGPENAEAQREYTRKVHTLFAAAIEESPHDSDCAKVMEKLSAPRLHHTFPRCRWRLIRLCCVYLSFATRGRAQGCSGAPIRAGRLRRRAGVVTGHETGRF